MQSVENGWKSSLLACWGGILLAITGSATAVWAQNTPAEPTPAQPTATPVEALKVAKGFHVELLYSVPQGQQGSWVSMCVDPRGRLIVCDQYGGLYRVTAPPLGVEKPVTIEKIAVDIGEAQGLLWAFDSLYVMVNRGRKYESGLYRVRDTDGDDQLDSLETLRKLDGGGEHGPHAVLLAPDKQSLYVVCGNNTKMTEFAASRVPQVWDEDQLLPRTYGRGFMKGRRAAGGYVARIDPDGKRWELVATGFRNEYDAALNADGELFTYDADMEWDVNTPWYRPTRVCHVVSGADFGWRNGAGKWPAHYPDSLPAAGDVGPGSPTGVCFGYGARFPAKYQRALYLADWSYGKLYAMHLSPDGASYRGELEEFITGTPLPLTDLVVNPQDGAMYFAIGGRRVQSGLYRVTYQGDEDAAPAELTTAGQEQRDLRRRLERMHLPGARDLDLAWQHLNSPDRFVRHAARIAVEQIPWNEWSQRALEETDPDRALAALMALIRQVRRTERGQDEEIDTPAPSYPAEAQRHDLYRPVLAALQRLSWESLNSRQRLEVLRNYGLAFLRLGAPDEATRASLIERFTTALPCGDRDLDFELAQLMVYLQAPQAAAKVVPLLEQAPTQEEQINYAKTLRHLRQGWTMPLRKRYLQWFVRAAGYRGGASFGLFVTHIKEDALRQLNKDQKQALADVINARPASDQPQAAPPRPFVKKWSLAELAPLLDAPLKGRDYNQGRQLFGAANCFACHRYDNEGGAVGPDLTGLSGRFSKRDILVLILNPSKTVSDQYAAVKIMTVDGKVVEGRIVNLNGDNFKINTNMLNPNAQTSVNRKQIRRIAPSEVSMMPEGLLDTLNEEEILDLMAYLLSRGNRQAGYFSD